MNLAVKKFGEGEPETLMEFARRHGLTVEVKERSRASGLSRYYISFKHPGKCVEIVSRGGFLSTHGNGSTPDEAASDYARQLAGETLVIGARRPDERRIDIPNDFHHDVG